jgi:addiction module HigA family antidote
MSFDEAVYGGGVSWIEEQDLLEQAVGGGNITGAQGVAGIGVEVARLLAVDFALFFGTAQAECLFAASLAVRFRHGDVPPNRIGAIVNGTRSITADTALRLGTYFRVSPETWLGLQVDYDLRRIRQTVGDEIVRRVRTRPAA